MVVPYPIDPTINSLFYRTKHKSTHASIKISGKLESPESRPEPLLAYSRLNTNKTTQPVTNDPFFKLRWNWERKKRQKRGLCSFAQRFFFLWSLDVPLHEPVARNILCSNIDSSFRVFRVPTSIKIAFYTIYLGEHKTHCNKSINILLSTDLQSYLARGKVAAVYKSTWRL